MLGCPLALSIAFCHRNGLHSPWQKLDPDLNLGLSQTGALGQHWGENAVPLVRILGSLKMPAKAISCTDIYGVTHSDEGSLP